MMASGIGAYRNRADPTCIYVAACPDAPGGELSALRVGGIWKRVAPFTIGDLFGGDDDYLSVKDPAEAAALHMQARTLLALPPDPDDTIAWHDFRALRGLATEEAV
jgi:hypothetical protein